MSSSDDGVDPDDFPVDAEGGWKILDGNNDGEVTYKEWLAAGRSGSPLSDATGVATDRIKNVVASLFGGMSVIKSLKNFVGDPVGFLRAQFVPIAVGVVAAVVQPFIDVAELLFGGSQPQVYNAPNESWGLADIPVIIADAAGGVPATLVEVFLEVPASLIQSVAVQVPGPFDAVIAFTVTAGVGIGAARYGPVLVLAGLEAIPVIGGPLATLLGGAE